jgi:hypothetical protein
MAFGVYDRVKETSTTTGTGNITLAGTSTGFRTFSSVLSTNDQTFYAIVHRTANEWEVGIGTLTGATTLTRDQVYSSSSGTSLINFSAGTKDVFITQPGTKQLTPYSGTYYFDATAYEQTNTGFTNLFTRGFASAFAPGGNYTDTFTSQQTPYDPSETNGYFTRFLQLNSGGNPNYQAEVSMYASGTYSASSFTKSEVVSNGYWGGSRRITSIQTNSGFPTTTTNTYPLSNTTFVGFTGVPSFTYWDQIPFGGTTLPVHPGAIVLGDAETATPKFYRFNGTGWDPIGGGGGVTQIIAGTGISISPAGGTGVVTISAGGGGGGWWSLKLMTNSGPETIDLPAAWTSTATSGESLFIYASLNQPWGPPSPGGPWNGFGTTTYVGNRYALGGLDWPTTSSPVSLNNIAPANGYATAFTFNLAADANSSAYLPTLSSNTFTNSPFVGGFPPLGNPSSWKGHALVYAWYGPDITSTSTAPAGATIMDTLYDPFWGASIFAIDYDATGVDNLRNYTNGLITFPGSTWVGWVFWYTYT